MIRARKIRVRRNMKRRRRVLVDNEGIQSFDVRFQRFRKTLVDSQQLNEELSLRKHSMGSSQDTFEGRAVG